MFDNKHKKSSNLNQLLVKTKQTEVYTPDIEMVELAPFLNQYLLSHPSQELIDLQLYISKVNNKYRGMINLTYWFH